MHEWFLVAAAALAAAIQTIRKSDPLRAALWAWIPQGWRWLAPSLLGALIAATEAVASGEPDWRRVLLAAALGAPGIGGLAMGMAAALKESPVPWDGGRGGRRSLEEIPITVEPKA